MSIVGANYEALKAGAASMRRAADELDAHARSTQGTIGNLSWIGQVATAFVTMWNGGHRVRNVRRVHRLGDRPEGQGCQLRRGVGGSTTTSKMASRTCSVGRLGLVTDQGVLAGLRPMMMPELGFLARIGQEEPSPRVLIRLPFLVVGEDDRSLEAAAKSLQAQGLLGVSESGLQLKGEMAVMVGVLAAPTTLVTFTMLDHRHLTLMWLIERDGLGVVGGAFH